MQYITDIKSACAEIKKKVSIVQVISDCVGKPHKETGSGSWWPCPFHAESKPSFSANNDMGVCNCFGCHSSGDIVWFIQQFNSLSLIESIEYLVHTYNVDISALCRQPTKEEQDKLRYRLICEEALSFFTRSLCNNKELLEWYMSDTGFDIDQIVTYDVGHCPSVSSLIQHLSSKIKNVTQEEVDTLEFTNNVQWTNSLVYPVFDVNSKISRFYTKPMSQSADNRYGKYIGTSNNHPLFSNKLLFGLNIVKKDIRKNNRSLRLCEGFKAAIASNGVAVMGTQITDGQISLLNELNVKEIRVAFDGDDAGKSASSNIINQVHNFDGMHILICKTPDGEQPDGIRKKYGKDVLDAIFNTAILPVQFFVDLNRDKSGSLNIDDKFSLIAKLKDHLVKIPEIQLELTVKYLSVVLDVAQSSILDYITNAKLSDNSLFNRDAEISVLQTAILQPNQWSTIKQSISDVKVFTSSSHQYLYSAIESAHNKAKDNGTHDSVTPQVVRDEFKILFSNLPDSHKIIDIILTSESKYEFIDSLQKIVDFYRRRQGIEQSRVLQASLRNLNENTNNIVSKYRRNLISSMDIRKDNTNTPVTYADHVRKILVERSLRKSAIVGHDFTSIVDVDGIDLPLLTGTCLSFSGLQNKHMSIITAGTGVGKSILGLQIATSISVCRPIPDQVPILFIPLEMSTEEIGMRQVSLLTGINNDKVQAAIFDANEQSRVNKAFDMIASSQFYIVKPRTGTIDEIYSIIDEHVFKYGIGGVVLDYIQLIASGDADKGMSREQVIGRASKVMKFQVADSMNIFSLCIAQQNRKDGTSGGGGNVESMAGSYQISQDADEVMILFNKQLDQNAVQTNNANRKGFLDKKRGGVSDIVLEYYLDIDNTKSLRYSEIITPQQLLGINTLYSK